jgi:DNA-binding MarR family transcriptional regulator
MLAPRILLRDTCKPFGRTSVASADFGPAHFGSAELADADAVGTQVIRLVRLVERVQAAKSGPGTVERATYHLLVELVKGGPQRAGALADAVHSDPSTISRQIGHLCKLGWVERTADPEDGRASLLAATDEGVRVFERNRASRNVHFAALLAGWEPADRAALAQLLERFADDFEQFKTRASASVDAGKATA